MVQWWALIATSAMVVATAAGNVLVCLAITWERRLQNMTNYFLMSLAITDLMVAILVMPLGILTLVIGSFPLEPVYCLVWISLDVLFCTASIMHLCTISVDRYLSLRYPMKFGRNKTRRRVVLKIAFVWLLSIAMCLPLSLQYSKDYNQVLVKGVCQIPDPVYKLIGSIVSFYIPLGVMLITFALTVHLLAKQQQSLGDTNCQWLSTPPMERDTARRATWRRFLPRSGDRAPRTQPPAGGLVASAQNAPHHHSSAETEMSALDTHDLWLQDNEPPPPSAMSALHQFGAELLKLSRGLESLPVPGDRFKGNPITVDLMHRRFVLLTGIDHVEIVLKNTAQKSNDYKTVKALMGHGLFTARDMVLWRHNRRIISPFFKSVKCISHYIPVYMEESRAVVERIPSGEPINIFPLLGRTTLSIICRTGIGVQCTHAQCDQFIRDMECVLRAWQQRLFRPWLMIGWVFRRTKLCKVHDAGINGLRGFAWQMVQERRRMGETSGKPTVPTFVDALLEEYNPDNKEEARQVVDEVMTVLVGGQETTATEISFALLMLAMHPHEQEKVHQEISQVFKGRSERDATFDDLAQLRNLDCVINETLRLFPALPLVSRELQETTDFGDFILPKGQAVPMFIYETHRKPEVWQNPHSFQPSRFASPETTAKRPQYSYIPFASGVRYCVGQRYALLQMKSILCTILRHFRVSPVKGLEKMDDIQLEVNTTLKIHGGFNVVFHRRSLED